MKRIRQLKKWLYKKGIEPAEAFKGFLALSLLAGSVIFYAFAMISGWTSQ